VALSQKRIHSLPKFLDIKPIPQNALEKMGFSWHKDEDGEYIVRDKFVVITSQSPVKISFKAIQLHFQLGSFIFFSL